MDKVKKTRVKNDQVKKRTALRKNRVKKDLGGRSFRFRKILSKKEWVQKDFGGGGRRIRFRKIQAKKDQVKKDLGKQGSGSERFLGKKDQVKRQCWFARGQADIFFLPDAPDGLLHRTI